MDILDVKNLIKRVPKEHSIVLLGPPGVGKTTVIRQIARELAK
ncbi:MAG TPA: ATP-binding protein, partial [Candidatus Bathyarchaeota archaeon]|nr:ATP-binding protein [Candidatus Bathyarchaeota archaeon]